jgi:hypothetical protein
VKALTILKHVFIPHEHNDYKPHFFREVSLGVIVALSIFLLGVSAGSSVFIRQTVLGANITASVLIDLTNESRIAYNESPLARNELLDKAAQMKAADMVDHGYFAHNSPTGVTPWHWFKEAGYTFLYAGENLAINFVDAQAVRDAWLASPKHRENLLDIKFEEIGMAAMDGMYKDGSTMYIVQLFGTPATPKKEIPAQLVEATTTTPETIPRIAPTSVIVAQNEDITTPSGSGAPEIKGATTTPYEPIITTKELAVVKNTDEVDKTSPSTSVTTYSTWYGRMIFGAPHYVQVLYQVLLVVIILALIVMLAIEFKRQHWKHIAYALALVLVVTLCILINQMFF